MDALRINEYVTQQSRTMNLVYQQRKGPADLNQEIKMEEVLAQGMGCCKLVLH